LNLRSFRVGERQPAVELFFEGLGLMDRFDSGFAQCGPMKVILHH
jgi:hypothetical protein